MEKVKKGWENKMKKKQNEAVTSRQQRKKIGQKHVKEAVVTKSGVAMPKT